MPASSPAGPDVPGDHAPGGGRAPRAVAYGPADAQSADLHLPAGQGPHPVVVLIHGGFWTALFDHTPMNRLAGHLAERGHAVWNIDYRGIGAPGGGWPGTFQDVADALDTLSALAPEGLDLGRVVTIGHSAGGHLALWAAARHRLPVDAPGARPRVRPCAAVSVAGVADLRAGHAQRVGDVLSRRAPAPADAPPPTRRHLARQVLAAMRPGAVAALLGGGPDEVPERYRSADPMELLGSGVPQLLVHSTADAFVPSDLSARYARTARAAGDDVLLRELTGAGHFDVLDPAGESWRCVEEHLPALLEGCSASA